MAVQPNGLTVDSPGQSRRPQAVAPPWVGMRMRIQALTVRHRIQRSGGGAPLGLGAWGPITQGDACGVVPGGLRRVALPWALESQPFGLSGRSKM